MYIPTNKQRKNKNKTKQNWRIHQIFPFHYITFLNLVHLFISFCYTFLTNPENFFYIFHANGQRSNTMASWEASCISSLLSGITKALCVQGLAQDRLAIHTFFPPRQSGIQQKKYRTPWLDIPDYSNFSSTATVFQPLGLRICGLNISDNSEPHQVTVRIQ